MRRSSWLLPALAAVLAFVAAVVGVRLATAGDPVTEPGLVEYQDAIHVPLAEGGRLVQEQLKPAVAAGRATKADAQRWAAELEAIRVRVARVTPPAGLRLAHRFFDEALGHYADVARILAEGNRDLAVAAAEAADRIYDDGSRIIQRERRRLGLGPTAKFPDPQGS